MCEPQRGSETHGSMVGEIQDNDKTGYVSQRRKRGTLDVTAFNVIQQSFNAQRLLRQEEGESEQD